MRSHVDFAGADQRLAAVQEFILLTMLVAAPWAFGAEEPAFQGVLFAGVAILAILGAGRLLIAPRLVVRSGPVACCLGALVLLSAVQLAPLPRNVLNFVSPKTTEIRNELLPDRPEVLAGTEDGVETRFRQLQPITLNPAGTRLFLIQMAALFVVAIIVRHQIANPAFIQRLRWTAMINGSALSFLAIAQAASSSPNLVYWNYPTEGSVYGPFICRNHFPFYMALCIGLALPLLADKQPGRSRRPRVARPVQDSGGLLSILQDPRRLWVLCGLALMSVASVFSLSRGGIIAMSLSAIAVLFIGRRQLGRNRSFAIPLVGALVAGLLAVSLGTGSIEKRFTTLERPIASLGQRVAIWRSVLPHLPQFPIFGSGGGTFAFMEPMYRGETNGGDFYVAEFAHNEYLEAAFEGGLLRLGITILLVIGLIVVIVRAIRANPSRPDALALMGGLWAVLTIAIHSFVDFGLHLPAIALLATVTATSLDCLSRRDRHESPSSDAGRHTRWVAAVLAIGIAIFLGEAGAAKFLAAHYQSQAVALSKSPKESDRDRQFEYWEAAVLWQRSDPTLQQAAGQAYLRRLAELEQADSRRDTLAHVGRALFAIDSTGGPSMVNLIAEISGERFHGALVVAEGETQRRQRMRCRSAKHSLAARALCPLLAEAHWQLADAAGCFSQSDRPEVYLHRAARLRPTDATIWYALGLTCRQSKDHEGAASAWRNCLQINDRFLKQILGNARGEFTLEGIQNELLPPRAETWLTAADMLFPESDQIQRRPFLERALALLEERAEKSTDDLHRLAEIRAELAAPEDKVSCDRAIDSYCAALQRAPMRDDWRLEFARFLHKIGKLAEAKSQLDLVLSQDPGNGFANKLLLVVDEELRLNGTADKK